MDRIGWWLSLRSVFLRGMLLFCFMVMPVMAGEYKLPDTGIEKCYDQIGAEIPCPAEGEPYYGQDAQYDAPKMAYQDNGDGTVTDLNTGLMWQQSDDGVGRQWQEACDYCDRLNLAGYSDWRIPLRRELFSIVDFGRYDPAVNTDYFPDCRSSWYWAGSTLANVTDYAWIVSFYNGYVNHSNKTNDYYDRCVHSGP